MFLTEVDDWRNLFTILYRNKESPFSILHSLETSIDYPDILFKPNQFVNLLYQHLAIVNVTLSTVEVESQSLGTSCRDGEPSRQWRWMPLAIWITANT